MYSLKSSPIQLTDHTDKDQEGGSTKVNLCGLKFEASGAFDFVFRDVFDQAGRFDVLIIIIIIIMIALL